MKQILRCLVAIVLSASLAKGMDIQRMNGMISTSDDFYQIHEQLTENFRKLDCLPINSELVGAQRYKNLPENQQQVIAETMKLFDKYKAISSQCSDDIKCHMLIDWFNFAYYLGDMLNNSPLPKDTFISLLDNLQQYKMVRKETHYYKNYSTMKILNCENSPYRRYDFSESWVTRKAWHIAMDAALNAPDVDTQLYRMIDVMILTMLVKLEPTETNPFFPFTESPHNQVKKIYLKAIGSLKKENSPALTAIRQLYGFIQNNEPSQVYETLKFNNDAMVTTLHEPAICQHYRAKHH